MKKTEAKIESNPGPNQLADAFKRLCKADLVKECLEPTEHVITAKGSTLWCKHCNVGVPLSAPLSKLKVWLSLPCAVMRENAHNPIIAKMIMDPSHTPASYKGVHYCVSCGSWRVRKSVKLSQACLRHAVGAGKAFLQAIERGHLPQGLPAWPIP